MKAVELVPRKTNRALKNTMLIIDKDYNIESISENGLTQLRKEKENGAVVGSKCYQLVHGTGQPPAYCPLKNSQQPQLSIADYLDQSRELFRQPPPVKCLPLYDEDGNILKILALPAEVPPLPATGEILAEAGFRLREVLDAIPHAIILTDIMGTITDANRGALTAFGVNSQGEITERSIYDFVAPGERHLLQQGLQKALAEGLLERSEHTFRRADGTGFAGILNASVLKESSGTIAGFIIGIRNVAAWRQLKEALHLSDNLLNSIQECVIAWDTDYTITYWNKAAENIYGVNTKEALGKKLYDIFTVREAHLASGQPDSAKIKPFSLTSDEYLVKTPAAEVWVQAVVQPVEQDGKLQGWVAIANDITPRRQAREYISIMDSTIESSINAVALANLDGKLTYVNRSFLSLWGYEKPEDVTGKPVTEFWQSREQAAEVARLLPEKGSWTGELTAKRQDGTNFDVQLTASMVTDRRGKPLCMMASFVDITAARKAREELEESQAFIASLLEYSHHPILVINPDTSIRYVNPALEKLTGFTGNELSGRKAPYPWAIAESMPRTIREFRLAMSRGPKWFEEFYRRKDGRRFWVEVTSAPVMKNGQLAYYMVSWVDITDRRLIEEELTKERDRQKTYLDTVGVMVATVDSRGRITMVNKKGCEILDYQERELIGKNWFNFLVPPLMRAEARRMFRSLLRVNGNSTRHSESVLVTKSGEERFFAFTNTLIKPPGKKVMQILSSGEDITELRKTQEQLEQTNLLASLGEMTAGIAHEVNNPLGSILLYSELLMAGDAPPQIKKDLRVIHDEARRATRIMTDLLTYARRTRPEVRKVNLHTILRRVLEMRRYQHKVQNIAVTAEFLEEPLFVRGDASQLMQVFMNLILNAEEALREHKGGKIKVTTHANSQWAKVTVADDGPGIKPEHLKQIFYPFFTTKPVGEGTGLGLSICYGIVTAHQGFIRAENNTAGGSTFTVELPLFQSKNGNHKSKKQNVKTPATAPKKVNG